MIARVTLNDKYVGALCCPRYERVLHNPVVSGDNKLKIEVTSTWYNKLVYDASLSDTQRRTWMIAGPNKDSSLRKSSISGPVFINVKPLSKWV
ncbi:MAG: hypothetical protein EOO20_02630 [Chryseobacterium sp.]|nr:MAG: hypothetical protein EOO20_02630 [Chryseobacterium sp.]